MLKPWKGLIWHVRNGTIMFEPLEVNLISIICSLSFNHRLSMFLRSHFALFCIILEINFKIKHSQAKYPLTAVRSTLFYRVASCVFWRWIKISKLHKVLYLKKYIGNLDVHINVLLRYFEKKNREQYAVQVKNINSVLIVSQRKTPFNINQTKKSFFVRHVNVTINEFTTEDVFFIRKSSDHLRKIWKKNTNFSYWCCWGFSFRLLLWFFMS